MNNQETHSLYIDIAKRVALCSKATRKKVGCVIVKDNNILSFGFNGTPKGTDNCCEDENGITKIEVLHAETNAISKALIQGTAIQGANIYITLSPCIDCAKILFQAGIKNVYYNEEYRDNTGIIFLKKMKININLV